MFKTSCKGSIREEGNEDIESDKEDELVGDDGDDSEEIEWKQKFYLTRIGRDKPGDFRTYELE